MIQLTHLPRSDHVVGRDRRADHLHQDVCISFFGITNALQKRPVIKQLWRVNSSFKWGTIKNKTVDNLSLDYHPLCLGTISYDILDYLSSLRRYMIGRLRVHIIPHGFCHLVGASNDWLHIEQQKRFTWCHRRTRCCRLPHVAA